MLARLLITAVFALACQSAEAEDWFDCSVNHSFELDDGGFLEKHWSNNIEQSFSFDRDSGRYVDGSINWQFSVVQKGDDENSMKALRLIEGPATKVLQTLQINTFSENEFIYVFGDEVRAGYCARRSDRDQ